MLKPTIERSSSAASVPSLLRPRLERSSSVASVSSSRRSCSHGTAHLISVVALLISVVANAVLGWVVLTLVRTTAPPLPPPQPRLAVSPPPPPPPQTMSPPPVAHIETMVLLPPPPIPIPVPGSLIGANPSSLNSSHTTLPSSRVFPTCNVHVFQPGHKTSTKSRQGDWNSQYDIFSRIAPRVSSTPRSRADWILFGSDLTFRDAHRYPAIRELTKLAANSTVPIVASSFFIHTRVPHLPRRSRCTSSPKWRRGVSRFWCRLRSQSGASWMASRPPPEKRRTALFVGHVPQLWISTTRWRIWRQLYNRSDATVASPDVWTLGIGLECARNGTWQEHCTGLHGPVNMSCDLKPRSATRCRTVLREPGFLRDFVAAGWAAYLRAGARAIKPYVSPRHTRSRRHVGASVMRHSSS